MNVFLNQVFKNFNRKGLGWDEVGGEKGFLGKTNLNRHMLMYIVIYIVPYNCDDVIRISAQLSGSTTRVCEV